MKTSELLTRLFSRRCCGGPVLILALVCGLVGASFMLLSAVMPGAVFMAAGVSSLGLCLALGSSRCRNTSWRASCSR